MIINITVVSRVSAHGCLNITRDFGSHGHLLTRDQIPIRLYISCYSGPLKSGTCGSGRLPGTLQYVCMGGGGQKVRN